MIDGILLALALLIGAATVLSVAIAAVASVTRRGQASHHPTLRDLPPYGGTRHDRTPHPQPDTDDTRPLVLL